MPRLSFVPARARPMLMWSGVDAKGSLFSVGGESILPFVSQASGETRCGGTKDALLEVGDMVGLIVPTEGEMFSESPWDG